MGGTAAPTTWRADVAIPLLSKAGISFFNPQVPRFSNVDEVLLLEALVKSRSRLLLRCGKRFLLLIVTTLAAIVRPKHFRWRKRLAELLHIIGMASGLVGVRLKHR